MLITRRRETTHNSSTHSARAVGADARLIEERLCEALAELQTVQRSVALEELREAFRTAGSIGWDHEEAVPVSAATYVAARNFLRTLPTAYPNPEVAALEDGTIAMDWFPSEGSNFTVVVFPEGRVAFASVTPSGSTKGIYRFADDVPEPIVDELRRVF